MNAVPGPAPQRWARRRCPQSQLEDSRHLDIEHPRTSESSLIVDVARRDCACSVTESSDADVGKDDSLVKPKEQRRWRRNKDGPEPQANTGHSHRNIVLQSEDNAAVQIVEGLCPRSKLSFVSPVRLLQNPALSRDFASVLQGGAHHLKGIFCEASDMNLFERLKHEIEDSGLWRQRSNDTYERTIAPEGGQRTTGRITGEDALTLAKLPAHRFVLEHLAGLFNSKPLSWWINLYPSGNDSKNFHKDNFGQNITIGASFGATRNLTFRHGVSRDEFHFPQENGDVFAFREAVNSTFLHGMYPLRPNEEDPGPRISVIMMGRSKNEHRQ